MSRESSIYYSPQNIDDSKMGSSFYSANDSKSFWEENSLTHYSTEFSNDKKLNNDTQHQLHSIYEGGSLSKTWDDQNKENLGIQQKYWTLNLPKIEEMEGK